MMNLYGAHDHVLVLTDKIDADFHKHSFIQIAISMDFSFEIEVSERCFESRGIIIGSNVSHRFDGHHNTLLFLLIDNTSSLAVPFKRLTADHQIYTLPNTMLDQTATFVMNNYGSIIDTTSYAQFLMQLLGILNVEYVSSEPTDQRIMEILNLLKDCDGAEYSIKALAGQVNLSNSRLSHLFKDNTGISLGGYLVLHKLQKAIYLVLNGMSMTTAALSSGFDSPSHFAATVKRLLGMSAKEIGKDSVFLKVSP